VTSEINATIPTAKPADGIGCGKRCGDFARANRMILRDLKFFFSSNSIQTPSKAFDARVNLLVNCGTYKKEVL